MSEYKLAEIYRGWAVWQQGTQPVFRANTKAGAEVKGVSLPDTHAAIDEVMRTKLAAFENELAGGPNPTSISGLTKAQKKTAADLLTKAQGNINSLGYVNTKNPAFIERKNNISSEVKALLGDVRGDPSTHHRSTPTSRRLSSA